MPSQPAAADSRSLTLAELGDYLRTVNNRNGLDAWMTANCLDGDVTTVDTAMLNRYFGECYQAHGQSGRRG